MKLKKSVLLAGLCASVMFLSGCVSAEYTAFNQHTQNGNALYLKYLPVTQALYGSWCSEENLNTLDTVFHTRTSELSGIFQTTAVSGSSQMTVIPHEDSYIQLCNYCPAANVLYENKEQIQVNPIMTITPMLKSYDKSELDKKNTELEWKPRKASVYQKKADFLSGLAAEIFGNNAVSYYVGYSISEDLYYIYVMDFAEDLYVISLYFQFDDDNVLIKGGIDYVICGGNTLCAEADASYQRSCISLDFNDSFVDTIYSVLGGAIGACTDKDNLEAYEENYQISTAEQAYTYQADSGSTIAYQGCLWCFFTETEISEEEETYDYDEF